MVGDVCALAESFHWAKDRPLGGKQILITRPRQNSSRLAKKLRELGAQVIELPSIVTEPISPNLVLKEELERFGSRAEEEWLVFTSPAGVQIFFEELGKMDLDIRRLFRRKAEIKFAVIGSATEKALNGYGIHSDLLPKVYCARNLGMDLANTAAQGSYVTVASFSWVLEV